MHSLKNQEFVPQNEFRLSQILIQSTIREKDVLYSRPFSKDGTSAFSVKWLEKVIYKVERLSSCHDSQRLRPSCPVWQRVTLSNAVVLVKPAV